MMLKPHAVPLIMTVAGAVAVSLSPGYVAAGGKDNIKVSYALASARFDLASAIKQTEAQFGGTVIKADFEREHGHYMYEIDVAKDSKVTEVMFDPKSGTLHASDVDDIDSDQTRSLAALRSAKTSLVTAIAIAMDHAHARAKEAKFEEDDGNFYFEIELVSDAKEYDVMIDPATGKVLWMEADDDD